MTNFTFPFPALVCDTGGTNVRFALVSEPGGRLSDIVHLQTGDYPGLAEAIEAAVPKLATRPRSIIACGAGPVAGRTLKLTNAPWVMDGPEAARRTGLKQGLLLNDFEAQALSLPTIPEGWERRIGPLKFGPEGPQVILGPGTGLGIAALVEADGRFTPVSSEACHIDFGPVRPEEFEIWPHLERAHGRITSESVISGAGLARVHRARMIAKGAPDPHVDPPAVTAAAAVADLSPLSLAATTMLAAKRLTSHSKGPGRVSSKSRRSNDKLRSGVAHRPKFSTCASPHSCTVSPLLGCAARSAAMTAAAPR